MHSEIREQNDKVLLHTDYEACVTFKTPCDNLHMVAHTEVLPQLMSWELKRVLNKIKRQDSEAIIMV